MKSFRILFFGDIVGAIGRHGVVKALPELRAEHAPDFVIANVENLSHGRGISPKTLLELDAAGIDAYTSGNHVWENQTGLSCFDDPRWKDRLVRPANVKENLPGRGSTIVEKNGVRVLIINLMGTVLMTDDVTNPFEALDDALRPTPPVATGGATPNARIVLVDFHTEATSEKEAFGHYADGRIAAVLGTHTHVPTADAKILPGGTAYITDVGRNGAYDSVIGFEKNSAVKAFLNPELTAYDLQKTGKMEINAVLLTADLDTRLAVRLDRIRKIVDI